MNTEKKKKLTGPRIEGSQDVSPHTLSPEDLIQPRGLSLFQGLGQKLNRAGQCLLAPIGLTGDMGAIIPDPEHFELSWQQSYIVLPIIQMIIITLIILL